MGYLDKHCSKCGSQIRNDDLRVTVACISCRHRAMSADDFVDEYKYDTSNMDEAGFPRHARRRRTCVL